jgi:hypothetical protein
MADEIENETDPQLAAQAEAEGKEQVQVPDEAGPASGGSFGGRPGFGPPEAAIDYSQQENLAAVLPYDFLKRVGAQVIQQARMDYRSMRGWREKTAEHHKLYNGDTGGTIPGQENLTVMHLPYTKRAVRIFHSKMYPNLFPESGEIVVLKVKSPGLQEIAERCTLHMNQQLVNECVEYIPSHDRGMKQDLIEGSIFEVWVYDPVEGRPRNEICLAEDVWIAYKTKTDRPDLKDVPRITWRIRYYQHELEAMEDSGYYVGITQAVNLRGGTVQPIFPDGESYADDGTPRAGGDVAKAEEDDQPVKDEADDFVGTEGGNDPLDTDAPRTFFEQDRMLKLPGERRQRAVTVCVDRATGNVARLVLREMEDRRDKKRWKDETALWEQQTRSAQVMYEEQTKAWQQASARSQQQTIHDPAQELGAFAGVVPNPDFGMDVGPPPRPPAPLPQPAPVKRVPWPRWVKYDCDINPAGALGHGIPHDVAGHNELADKVATRAVSLLTLNMLPTGLISRQSRFARGEIKLKLGQFNEVPLSPIEVERGAGIMQLQFPAPDAQWVKTIELADASSQELTAFDIAAGGPGMSGETATESDNRHSSATSNISMIGSRYNRARGSSLRNLAYINSQTLPESGVTIWVEAPIQPPAPAPMPGAPGQQPTGGEMLPPEMAAGPAPTSQPKPEMISVVVTREDYAQILDELEVTFTTDPNMESQVIKERRAMKTFQTAMQVATTPIAPGVPMLDPTTTAMIMRATAAKVFEALEMPKEIVKMVMNSPLPDPAAMMMSQQKGEGDGNEEGDATGGGPGGMDGSGPGRVPAEQGGPLPA